MKHKTGHRTVVFYLVYLTFTNKFLYPHKHTNHRTFPFSVIELRRGGGVLSYRRKNSGRADNTTTGCQELTGFLDKSTAIFLYLQCFNRQYLDNMHELQIYELLVKGATQPLNPFLFLLLSKLYSTEDRTFQAMPPSRLCYLSLNVSS